MRILAIEPYYGGSHRAFLDGWSRSSAHEWTILSLPAHKWKWRMRHAALTLSRETVARHNAGERWDLVFCSDMLNLAEFKGLAPSAVNALPAVAYFHENQVTYPVREENERDFHFVFSNLMTALAAKEVWFNSAFHRDSFLEGLRQFLRRMPDYQPLSAAASIQNVSRVVAPGIDTLPSRPTRRAGPMRVLWAARWEFDKSPGVFFDALRDLKRRGVAFELNVVGGDAGHLPLAEFQKARNDLADHIRSWGYLEDREAYLRVLSRSDVVVSTAAHEFFGIAVLEAVAAGAFPLLPRRLAYPEIFGCGSQDEDKRPFFYDGGRQGLGQRLMELAEAITAGDLWQEDPERGIRIASNYQWEQCAARYDRFLEAVRLPDPPASDKPSCEWA